MRDNRDLRGDLGFGGGKNGVALGRGKLLAMTAL